MSDRWHMKRPREIVNCGLERIGLGSFKLESINSIGENSYRVM